MNTRLRFDVAQAAEYAGVHPETIRKAVRAQELHGGQRRKCGRWSFRRECIDAWLEGQPCEHKADAA